MQDMDWLCALVPGRHRCCRRARTCATTSNRHVGSALHVPRRAGVQRRSGCGRAGGSGTYVFGTAGERDRFPRRLHRVPRRPHQGPRLIGSAPVAIRGFEVASRCRQGPPAAASRCRPAACIRLPVNRLKPASSAARAHAGCCGWSACRGRRVASPDQPVTAGRFRKVATERPSRPSGGRSYDTVVMPPSDHRWSIRDLPACSQCATHVPRERWRAARGGLRHTMRARSVGKPRGRRSRSATPASSMAAVSPRSRSRSTGETVKAGHEGDHADAGTGRPAGPTSSRTITQVIADLARALQVGRRSAAPWWQHPWPRASSSGRRGSSRRALPRLRLHRCGSGDLPPKSGQALRARYRSRQSASRSSGSCGQSAVTCAPGRRKAQRCPASCRCTGRTSACEQQRLRRRPRARRTSSTRWWPGPADRHTGA